MRATFAAIGFVATIIATIHVGATILGWVFAVLASFAFVVLVCALAVAAVFVGVLAVRGLRR